MAIDKKLIHFKTKENFISQGVGSEENVTKPTEGSEENGNAIYGQLKGTSIVFIKDSNEIWTHGNLYKSVNWSVLTPPPPPAAGDIVYYKDGSLKTVKYTEWKTDLGTPVGVITIPEGFAPDGKARMVALSGQTSTTWATSTTDTSLPNYNRVPTADNAGSTSTGSNSKGYLPSDRFTGATSYVDSVAKYSQTSNLIPSPYAGDAPNPDYYKTISGYNNALSDFSGKANTELLVGLETDYPAANACWTYSDGISNTKWYLPAMGELGYMMPRFNEINAGLAKVNAVQLDSSDYYWSSSEYSSNYAYTLYASNGRVLNRYKDNGSYARPWAVVE